MYNRYLIPGVIPDEINTNRLFCLNKKADEIGNVDNLRPIAISSTFIKYQNLQYLKDYQMK